MKDPAEMLRIARMYHADLQSKPPMNGDQEKAITEILSKVKIRLNKEESRDIEKSISYKEVYNVLKQAPNGKAPGPDGILIEFWKSEIKRQRQEKEDKKNGIKGPDNKEVTVRPCIAALMTKVLKDVESFGPIDEQFLEGRMGLLYKKKDKRDIQNYCPITLLNTDYKTYTKIIANRLRKVAPKLIHKDQAGFMPKRSIYDQTKIVELMVKWSENTGNNSIVVCLDQEKAYDRIDLEYLWRTLEAFGFPATFIAKVRNLYQTATTRIRINGFVSKLFDVSRGVRQGDPMSCLLYNLAIEPLIESIRLSPLKGF